LTVTKIDKIAKKIIKNSHNPHQEHQTPTPTSFRQNCSEGDPPEIYPKYAHIWR
jgi:hypothetical protein